MELPASLLRQTVSRGSVLLSDMFENVDHSKYFVVMGVFEDQIAGFFFINSRIHPMLLSKPEQLAMQYQLRKKDYDFLRYDSFLSASYLQVRSVDLLVESMKKNHTILVGQLTDEDLEMVLVACRESKLFTPKEKRQFFY